MLQSEYSFAGHGEVAGPVGAGSPATLRVAKKNSQTQASFLVHSVLVPEPRQGPQRRWEKGDPLISPWCIPWAVRAP